MTIEAFIAQHQAKDLLRLLFCGSVDDGKSTLLGRLLHDGDLVLDDQMAALKRDSRRRGSADEAAVDFSLLTDGLEAEREQGITIDVAYRYFTTARRKFIIADAPGHEQYTRNMVTGASNCNLAVILVDARRGVTLQTRRHSFIVSLLGIPHVVVAVNKMDAVDWSSAVFEAIRREYSDFAARLSFGDLHFIPISALLGDNVVHRSRQMPWHRGTTVLDHLESVHVASDRNLIDLRLPIQQVLRPDQDHRSFAGRIASGILRVGDELLALPSKRFSRVGSLQSAGRPVEQAVAGESIALTLEHEIDLSRGDMLVHPGNLARPVREFEAMLVWMGERPMRPGGRYLVKTCSGTVPGMVSRLRYEIDVSTLRRTEAESLAMNAIGRVRISCLRPVVAEAYQRNRVTGAFILIDRLDNDTVGAGMVREVEALAEDSPSPAIAARESLVRPEERSALLGHRPFTLWLTGLPKSGKSTLAVALERALVDEGRLAQVLDGSELRSHLSNDLGFGAEDRSEHVRRLAAVAAIGNRAGLISIVAAVAPYDEDRRQARRITEGSGAFLLVHVDAPLATCEARDTEGGYRRARAGELADFTGITAPYEAPTDADLVLPTGECDVVECVRRLRERLDELGLLRPS